MASRMIWAIGRSYVRARVRSAVSSGLERRRVKKAGRFVMGSVSLLCETGYHEVRQKSSVEGPGFWSEKARRERRRAPKRTTANGHTERPHFPPLGVRPRARNRKRTGCADPRTTETGRNRRRKPTKPESKAKPTANSANAPANAKPKQIAGKTARDGKPDARRQGDKKREEPDQGHADPKKAKGKKGTENPDRKHSPERFNFAARHRLGAKTDRPGRNRIRKPHRGTSSPVDDRAKRRAVRAPHN